MSYVSRQLICNILFLSFTSIAVNAVIIDRVTAKPIRPAIQRAMPSKGNADDLRPAPGLPITPTVASPLVFTPRPTSVEISIVQFPSAITVIPYIPNASPTSPARNAPGAFTSDPVQAVPIILTQPDRSKI